METQILYKITNNGHSWNEDLSNTKFIIDYALGVKAIPVCGKILTFAKPENLIRFVMATCLPRNPVIFEGIGENPHPVKLLVRDPAYYLKRFWELKKMKRSFDGSYLFNTPKGTIGVDSFTPTKEYTWLEFFRRTENE